MAAVTFVRSTVGSTTTAATLTLTVTAPTVGDYLVVSVFGTTSNSTGPLNADLSTATVTDNATGGTNTYTRQTALYNNTVDSVSNFDSAGIAVFLAPVSRTNAGTFTVTITTSINTTADNGYSVGAVVSEWSGVAGSEGFSTLNGLITNPDGYSAYPTLVATLPGDALVTSQVSSGDTAAAFTQGLGITNVFSSSGTSVEYVSVTNARQVNGTFLYSPVNDPSGGTTFAGIALLLKSTNTAVASVAGHNVEFSPREFPLQAYDAWNGFPRLPSTRYDALVYNRSTPAAVGGMVPAQSTKTVLYSEWTGFPRGPNPSQSLLFGRQQVAQPKQPWMAYTTPRRPTIEAEQDTAQRHTQFYNVAARTTTVTQPWMAYTTPRKPTVEAEQDVAQRRSQFYNPPYQTVGQPWIALTVPRKPVVEAEQDTAQRRTWFYNQQTTTVSGTVAIQGYTTNVLYESNTGFPRIPPPSQQLLFGRTTPTAPTPQPFYAYNWGKPPVVAAGDYSTYRTPANFQLFVQPPVVNGTLAYLAYQTTVLHEANTGFSRQPDQTANQALFFNRTAITPTVTQPFYAFHWQQPVTVEAEQYRVTSPFPWQSFYYRNPLLTIWQATYQVVNDNMIVYPIEWVTSPTIPWGYVVSRTPYPDASQPNWTYIKMTASLGPAAPIGYATVPNIVLLRSYDAITGLAALSLNSGTVWYANSGTVPFGYVISQSVTAGTVVPTGTSVSYVVSLGPVATTVYISVPSVVGLSLSSALSTLVANSLIVAPSVYQASAQPAGTVLSQSVAAGTNVLPWTTISLVVSSGTGGSVTYVTVPNIVGVTPAVANSSLLALGLAPLSQTYVYSAVSAGLIVSQTVLAGSSVAVGSNVGYSVSIGPQPVTPTVTVPNVAGVAVDAAKATLVNANLIVGPVTYAASGTVTAGNVISQSPAAGTSVNLWATVTIIVSSG